MMTQGDDLATRDDYIGKLQSFCVFDVPTPVNCSVRELLSYTEKRVSGLTLLESFSPRTHYVNVVSHLA
jgi:hypothetical protein